PVEPPLGLAHLAAQRIRPAAVGAAGLLSEAGSCTRLGPPRAQERGESIAFLDEVPVRLLVLTQRKVAGPLVVCVGSCELAHASRLCVERDDARDRPVEERAVMRDDDDRAAERVDEPFEAIEPR